ncbi:MAG: helix-turn-helix domain-containing protein [Sphingomonas sp.]|uniref:helix-turn-helix domain-containing protein n=1 Tax=Sphingomonas sp. TaxID=28214 RepID=UPI001216A209|nr:helix-turn-helix domain-containing protein [Sphingomonas sp.]THD36095.1 MAG: helix-turn-helix domain-containing protein [Sphingomonas sp.]
MDDDQTAQQESLFPKSTGDKLREAREGLGLTLSDIAGRTRVPMRHLEAIEAGDYSGLPSPTYAIGFAKAYARAVGLDEKAIANEVRNNPHLPVAPTTDYEAYQPRDTKHLPSRSVAMAAGAIAVLLLVGVAIWYGTGLFRGSEEPLAIPPENTIAAAPEATPTPVGGGQVTLTATSAVWVKIYDATGKTLLEKTMAQGERFDVPADANNPMITTGRPDQIQVTVNGSSVPPLGTGRVAIKDVPISAAALQARGTSAPTAAPAATPPPVVAPSPAASSAVPPAFRPTPRPTERPTPRPTPKAAPTPENLLPPSIAPTPAP